jgi:hypothetical protein
MAVGSVVLAVLLLLSLAAPAAEKGRASRRLPVKEYRDKMKAGWIGQIIGVSWGAPTEGRFREIMPADKMPPFSEDLVNNAFGQDDLYVEMTFLRSMEQHGFDVSIRQAGIDFANSGYGLWVANAAGRSNLRNGIAPPDSSHPKFHNCAGAIDYQIEADYAGLIAPGMPNTVIALGEKFGRLMNYGDGVYAGQFMGAMYAEAFFEKDPFRLIEAGLKAIPSECMYAEMVRDMLKWRRENPNDWEKTWALVDSKYRKDKNYNISALDVKLEGAFVLMGLLYGDGDLDKTITISCRCGSDSDCNPSSSGGVMFTTLGLAELPDRYYKKLDEAKIFSHTAYNFPALLDVCEKLARQALAREGGRVEKDANGEEVFVIPVKEPRLSKFEDLKKPGLIADSRFTDDEMRQIATPGLQWALPKVLAGWNVADAVLRSSSFAWERNGRRNVVLLRAGKAGEPVALTRKFDQLPGGTSKLTCAAGLESRNAGWVLTVKANGNDLLNKTVAAETIKNGWLEIEADLSAYAGKAVTLELIGQPQDKESKTGVVCCIADLSVSGERK